MKRWDNDESGEHRHTFSKNIDQFEIEKKLRKNIEKKFDQYLTIFIFALGKLGYRKRKADEPLIYLIIIFSVFSQTPFQSRWQCSSLLAIRA